MLSNRIGAFEALQILHSCNAYNVDFHALQSEFVDRLVAAADARGYRKPRNANGSRARCFHAYLMREAVKVT